LKSVNDAIDHGAVGIERNRESLEKSIQFYLRAAALFPDDEPEKQVLPFAASLIIDCVMVCD